MIVGARTKHKSIPNKENKKGENQSKRSSSLIREVKEGAG
jgi:hypothetical protein